VGPVESKKHFEYPLCSAIAITDWSNSLKLVMRHGHMNQRISVFFGLNETFTICPLSRPPSHSQRYRADAEEFMGIVRYE
jgi:hypothetical protein